MKWSRGSSGKASTSKAAVAPVALMSQMWTSWKWARPWRRGRGGEDVPVGGIVVLGGGDGGVAVGGVPVHGDAEDDGHVGEGEVVDADVFAKAAAGVADLKRMPTGTWPWAVRLKASMLRKPPEVSEPKVTAAAPSRMMESRRTTSVVGRCYAQAVGVPPGLEAEGVVVDGDVGVGDLDVGRRSRCRCRRWRGRGRLRCCGW